MQHNSSLQPGSIIRGGKFTYTIQSVLGQGSFGITYLASTNAVISGPLGNIETEIKVAIKEFFMKEFCSRHADGTVTSMSEGSLSDGYARKFRKEAENLAKLSHPGIVKVLEVFEANNTCYYSMQYISGGNLDSYVKSRGGISEDEAIGCIRRIGDAVQYMHEHRMLHLDLKPSNVMRNGDGSQLTLIDFGLSKQYDSNGEPESSTTVGLGTPGYAPIEQAEHKDGSGDFQPTIDIYALGATMYKLLTGKTPPKATEVTASVLDGDNLIQRELLHAGVSASVADSVSKAMWPSSKQRYQTVVELMNALGQTADTCQSKNLIDGVSSFEETLVVKGVIQTSVATNAHNSHEWVDLGLSVKWATCNVGASRPEDYGDYFAWGETSPKSEYTWANLKYCNDTTGDSYSKYNQNQGGTKDNRTILELSDDAARANWGGSWRMPTDAEFQELIVKCTWEWTKMNGKNGYKVVSKSNGNSIFLPAAGWRDGTSLDYADSYGFYWSSSLDESGSYSARYLYFYSGSHSTSDYYRRYGRSVRPVFR